MKHLIVTAALITASVSFVSVATAQSSPEVTLTRIDCGSGAGPGDIAGFSDTHAYDGKKQQLTVSCYLIKHGPDYMIWDTGYPTEGMPHASATGQKAKVSLVSQLAQVNVKPEQIKYVGISHYHGDHTGQAASFPQATLLIGKGDWDAVTATPPAQGVNPAPLVAWISGGGKVEAVPRDKDVFGDGTVTLLDMPGHTPGHHSLLVKLQQKGYILLTGDLAHFRENYDSNGVPTFNTNRADSLASLDRFKQLAKNLNATVIIQHEARDIDKLPAFPEAAK
ncbi:MAG TPA: N-acyl homoserine lactonase family protein [Povalibacter sp.]